MLELVDDTQLLVVSLCHGPVFSSLAIAGQQQDRASIGCLDAEHEVQQDERVRVPLERDAYQVQCNPNTDQYRLDNDEPPAANARGGRVGDALTERDGLVQLSTRRG